MLIVFHAAWFFAGVMGFGGASGNEPKIEILKALLFFAFIGASPNLAGLILALVRKKNIRLNVIWSMTFFTLIFLSYLVMFSSVLS